MKDNLRQNSRPTIFNMGSPDATRQAAEGTMENTYDVPTIPARYAPSRRSRLNRSGCRNTPPRSTARSALISATASGRTKTASRTSRAPHGGEPHPRPRMPGVGGGQALRDLTGLLRAQRDRAAYRPRSGARAS